MDRGVIQGDILSPLYCILVLELILRRHDAIAGQGVSLDQTRVTTLGYADDTVLLDVDKDISTKRVTSIAIGSRRDSDM